MHALKEASQKTLAEALELEELPHRDKVLAAEPMPNFSSTPNGPNGGLPLSFWAAWQLNDRPRRVALLLDDCQEEYREYAIDILPQLVSLVETFGRHGDGVCRVWSAWSRTVDDGISNAMDRWYGPRGLRKDEPENAVYIFGGAEGMKPLKEIAPTQQEIDDGWFYMGRHLDMFWNFDDTGKSYLDEKLKAEGIDTVVIAGLWTDECILSTAYAASSRGYDVVVVSDAVATATANQQAALTIANGTVAKVLTAKEVMDYMEKEFRVGQPGAVKGTKHPDGRKD
ncbi:Isochorismatase, hydrolase [Seminavis robusta]|uniref:Isochorismatase, hydrolase n=1 Tax=Seminavis robusta TaxID=568900 RepID=A0A9N8DJ42_9STRA|nr:Isochorismatase, hydrolase [Seminavis robusta]|eukprot:Sro112_g055800.1 Isochorismatase, hydrolase (283) ;mRNA; r:87844-88692